MLIGKLHPLLIILLADLKNKSINTAFKERKVGGVIHWDDTPQGHAFWSAIDDGRKTDINILTRTFKFKKGDSWINTANKKCEFRSEDAGYITFLHEHGNSYSIEKKELIDRILNNHYKFIRNEKTNKESNNKNNSNKNEVNRPTTTINRGTTTRGVRGKSRKSTITTARRLVGNKISSQKSRSQTQKAVIRGRVVL